MHVKKILKNINSFNIFSSQKHVYKNTISDVFSLFNSDNWLERSNYMFLVYFPTFWTLWPFEPQRKSNLGSLFSMSRKIADRIIPSKIQQKFAT